MQRVLQFGTGRFLRGFVDAFIDELASPPGADGAGSGGRVTAVETTGSGRAARLASQGCAYRLATRGLDRGARVDESRTIRVIDRVIDASADLEALVEAALDPRLGAIVSNTTEAGYVPDGFPRRLAIVLVARARAGLPGLVILPCELVERNGEQLLGLTLSAASRWGADGKVLDHVRDSNTWAVTLVDRIVTAPVSGSPDTADPLGVVVEPFASWVIEAPAATPLLEHACISRTTDVTPYALRKIRILNGAHTALVARTRGSAIRLVRDALDDPSIAGWLEALLLEEVVPALGERIVDGEAFAMSTLERFRNPFLDHRLADIGVDQARKLALRLLPTYHDHRRRFGRPPRRLAGLLQAEGVLP